MAGLLTSLARLLLVVVVGSATLSSADPAGEQGSAASAPPAGTLGYDVGSESCSSQLPSGGSFGIVAVTAGRPYYVSPCLASEYQWASGQTYRPQYYVNLADPGHRSAHWNRGGPRACDPTPRYDVGCAYDYGYMAAADAWNDTQAEQATGGRRWWLDVETDNTWGVTRNGIKANVAVIRGALRYLAVRQGARTGIYTETEWWDFITGGSTSFSSVPVWGGGADSKRHAEANCRPHSITGGPALLAQWISGGTDHDISC